MSQLNQLSLLAVGVEPFGELPSEIDIRIASTAKETVALMRMSHIDLVLAGKQIPDMDVWTLIRRIRTAWPGQRWILIDRQISPQEEIRARSLGALMVLDGDFDCGRLHQMTLRLTARLPAMELEQIAEREVG